MLGKIINNKRKIFISFILDISIFIVFSYISDLFIQSKITLNLLALPLWILISYISGRYHEFRIINKISITKNSLKTLLTSFILINFCVFTEILFNSKSDYFNLIDVLAFFYFFYGTLSLVFNLAFNYTLSKNNVKPKWLILESNNLLKKLKNDNIESPDFLSNYLIFISSIDQLKNYKFKRIAGIILEENFEIDEKLVMNFKKKGIQLLINSEWCENFLSRIPPYFVNEKIHGQQILYPKFNIVEYRFKKFVEFLISLFLIVLSSPIIILAAFLIYTEDQGPIFYSQIRKGIHGKTFRIFKLRTMKIDSEKDGIQWSSKDDPRITKIGRFLRKTRIDELPQLISVISGEMSLIGPRPERPEIDFYLQQKIPYYESRYNITPGITGWAQVNYPYASSMEDSFNKLSYDLYYLRNFSIFLDLLILFKTIRVVLDYKNASFN